MTGALDSVWVGVCSPERDGSGSVVARRPGENLSGLVCAAAVRRGLQHQHVYATRHSDNVMMMPLASLDASGGGDGKRTKG